jgi:hypothetical protein
MIIKGLYNKEKGFYQEIDPLEKGEFLIEGEQIKNSSLVYETINTEADRVNAKRINIASNMVIANTNNNGATEYILLPDENNPDLAANTIITLIIPTKNRSAVLKVTRTKGIEEEDIFEHNVVAGQVPRWARFAYYEQKWIRLLPS